MESVAELNTKQNTTSLINNNITKSVSTLLVGI